MSNNKHECCTPKGQVPRYVDCVGCDKKPIEGATLSYAQAQKDSFSIMEKKQSSIEYLVSEIENIGFSVNNTLEFYDIVQIAREMHKEEIEESWNSARGGDAYHTGNQYFNETFGETKN